MKLTHDWQKIALEAWSMWGLYLMIALSVVQAVLPFFEAGIPSQIYSGLMIALAGLTAVARVMTQWGAYRG
ncbi:hypothetical protein VWY34_14110 [Phaeobacter sp. JH20_02]|uniref:DUF7940 domain-containing protein n=1 Tax=unclassified Phaeobacter TaxID=2621772 RepID=UPI003A8C880F